VTLTKVLTAMEELEKWEGTVRDMEKMIAAVKRKKKIVKKKIDSIEKDIARYDALLEEEKKETVEAIQGFSTGRQ